MEDDPKLATARKKLRKVDYKKRDEQIKEMLTGLGIPLEASKTIIWAENDWLFFTHATAILESCLNRALASTVDGSDRMKNAMRKNFEKLPLGGKASKISFAKAHSFLTKDMEKFIQAVLEVRNFYAHDLSTYNTPAIEYILSSSEKNALKKSLGVGAFPDDYLKLEPPLVRFFARDHLVEMISLIMLL